MSLYKKVMHFKKWSGFFAHPVYLGNGCSSTDNKARKPTTIATLYTDKYDKSYLKHIMTGPSSCRLQVAMKRKCDFF